LLALVEFDGSRNAVAGAAAELTLIVDRRAFGSQIDGKSRASGRSRTQPYPPCREGLRIESFASGSDEPAARKDFLDGSVCRLALTTLDISLIPSSNCVGVASIIATSRLRSAPR
jgi:hypothetical protein